MPVCEALPCLPTQFLPIGFSFINHNVMGMVGQAIERRVGHDRVREQGHPVLRRPVARGDNGRPQVTLGDDLADVLRLDGRESREPEVMIKRSG